MNLKTSSCCASMRNPISAPFASSRRFSSSNGTVDFSRSASMIIAKNSRTVVWEISMILARASASTAETLAMMPTVSAPMTVTMMRFDLVGIGDFPPVPGCASLHRLSLRAAGLGRTLGAVPRSVHRWLAEAAALALVGAHVAAAQQEPFATTVPAPRTDENSGVARAELVRKAGSGVIDIYFIGDSITRRWGALDYPELLV